VYGIVGAPRTLETRSIETCLAHPMGFITGPSAGMLEGLRHMPFASRLTLCVPHGSRRVVPVYVQLRQSNLILPHHVRELDNGIRAASYERLAFDLASDLRVDALSSVVEQMIQRRHVTMESLVGVAGELCSRRRAGSTTFAKVLLRRTWGPAAESAPELRVLQALRQRGVPVQPQEWLTLRSGRAVRIDMAVPAVRWAIEVDIHPAHEMREGLTNDIRRDRQMHYIDWQIERVSAIDLLDFRAIIRELVELYRARCAAVARL
jgi:hypothetical protein